MHRGRLFILVAIPDGDVIDAATTWCVTEAGAHDFCDDFDHGAFATNWTVNAIPRGLGSIFGTKYGLELALYRAVNDSDTPALDLFQADGDGGSAHSHVEIGGGGHLTWKAWHHLVFEADFGSQPTASGLVMTSGTIDGIAFAVANPDVGSATLIPGPLDQPVVGLGTSTIQTATVSIVYDNVTIDAK